MLKHKKTYEGKLEIWDVERRHSCPSVIIGGKSLTQNIEDMCEEDRKGSENGYQIGVLPGKYKITIEQIE